MVLLPLIVELDVKQSMGVVLQFRPFVPRLQHSRLPLMADVEQELDLVSPPTVVLPMGIVGKLLHTAVLDVNYSMEYVQLLHPLLYLHRYSQVLSQQLHQFFRLLLQQLQPRVFLQLQTISFLQLLAGHIIMHIQSVVQTSLIMIRTIPQPNACNIMDVLTLVILLQ